MEDKALSLNPDYMEAMTYKNILLRMEANTEKDKKKQDELLKRSRSAPQQGDGAPEEEGVVGSEVGRIRALNRIAETAASGRHVVPA